MKLFRGSSSESESAAAAAQARRPTRRSSGLAELSRLLAGQEGLCILDMGSTSPTNIRYLTGHGHKVYSEDLLIASTDPTLKILNEEGQTVLDSKRFLAENLDYGAALFDCVLCWNLADYIDESLVKPVVGRLWSAMKPGGVLLAFFHTQDAGPDAPCYRYHITGNDTLEMQPVVAHPEARRGPSGTTRLVSERSLRLQRVFNNRHIENLFRDFASKKFFLARDNVREVLVVR
jgi:hypothetical protein